LTNGSAVCWGSNNRGQLGNGSTGGSSSSPVFVSGNYKFSKINIGKYVYCGVLINGSAVCWGQNDYGQLGNGSTGGSSSSPVFVSGNYEFSLITSGDDFSCGLLSNGSVACWGIGTYGQLGDGTTYSSSNIAKIITSANTFIDISAGANHICGILINGSAVCWGLGQEGQLGNGVSGGGMAYYSLTPVFVLGNYNFSTIFSGEGHSCGILTNGSAVCWGSGTYGQLGNNNIISSSTPVFVSGNYIYKRNVNYWNNNTFVSMLPSSYYSSGNTVSFECRAMNATSNSLPKNATLII
jgi:alpha-tubulin suppressor-like RCC1 family protein